MSSDAGPAPAGAAAAASAALAPREPMTLERATIWVQKTFRGYIFRREIRALLKRNRIQYMKTHSAVGSEGVHFDVKGNIKHHEAGTPKAKPGPPLSLLPRGVATETSRRLWRKVKKAVQTRAFTNSVMMDAKQREADRLVKGHNVKTQAKSMEDLMNTPKYMQGDLSMYTKENLRKRIALRSHEGVKMAIARWWNCITCGEDEADEYELSHSRIQKPQYIQMNCCIQLALIPESGGKPDFDSAEEDWANDARGESEMNPAMFHEAMFELADVWCSSVNAMEYVEFLDKVLRACARWPPWPPGEWRAYKDVVCIFADTYTEPVPMAATPKKVVVEKVVKVAEKKAPPERKPSKIVVKEVKEDPDKEAKEREKAEKAAAAAAAKEAKEKEKADKAAAAAAAKEAKEREKKEKQEAKEREKKEKEVEIVITAEMLKDPVQLLELLRSLVPLPDRMATLVKAAAAKEAVMTVILKVAMQDPSVVSSILAAGARNAAWFEMILSTMSKNPEQMAALLAAALADPALMSAMMAAAAKTPAIMASLVAMATKDPALMKAMLEACAKDPKAMGALVAAASKDPAAAEALMAAAAGDFALMSAILAAAARSKDTSIMGNLLNAAGKDPATLAQFMAAAARTPSAMATLLMLAQKDPAALALIMAAAAGNEAVMAALLAAASASPASLKLLMDAAMKDPAAMAALMAAASKDPGAMALLMAMAADNPALMEAMLAAAKGDPAIMAALLKAAANDPRVMDALLRAAAKDPEAMKALLEAAAKDPKLMGALLAAAAKNPDIMAAVLRAAASDPALMSALLAAAAKDPSIMMAVMKAASKDPALMSALLAAAAKDPKLMNAVLKAAAGDPAIMTALLTAAAKDPALMAAVLQAAAKDPALMSALLKAAAANPDLMAAVLRAAAQDPSLMAALMKAAAKDPSIMSAVLQAAAKDPALMAAVMKAAANDPNIMKALLEAAAKDPNLMKAVLRAAADDPSIMAALMRAAANDPSIMAAVLKAAKDDPSLLAAVMNACKDDPRLMAALLAAAAKDPSLLAAMMALADESMLAAMKSAGFDPAAGVLDASKLMKVVPERLPTPEPDPEPVREPEPEPEPVEDPAASGRLRPPSAGAAGKPGGSDDEDGEDGPGRRGARGKLGAKFGDGNLFAAREGAEYEFHGPQERVRKTRGEGPSVAFRPSSGMAKVNMMDSFHEGVVNRKMEDMNMRKPTWDVDPTARPRSPLSPRSRSPEPPQQPASLRPVPYETRDGGAGEGPGGRPQSGQLAARLRQYEARLNSSVSSLRRPQTARSTTAWFGWGDVAGPPINEHDLMVRRIEPAVAAAAAAALAAEASLSAKRPKTAELSRQRYQQRRAQQAAAIIALSAGPSPEIGRRLLSAGGHRGTYAERTTIEAELSRARLGARLDGTAAVPQTQFQPFFQERPPTTREVSAYGKPPLSISLSMMAGGGPASVGPVSAPAALLTSLPTASFDASWAASLPTGGWMDEAAEAAAATLATYGSSEGGHQSPYPPYHHAHHASMPIVMRPLSSVAYHRQSSSPPRSRPISPLSRQRPATARSMTNPGAYSGWPPSPRGGGSSSRGVSLAGLAASAWRPESAHARQLVLSLIQNGDLAPAPSLRSPSPPTSARSLSPRRTMEMRASRLVHRYSYAVKRPEPPPPRPRTAAVAIAPAAAMQARLEAIRDSDLARERLLRPSPRSVIHIVPGEKTRLRGPLPLFD